MTDDFDAAHKHCHKNRDEVLASERCGCFYCLKTFAPREITDWLGGTEAVCPHCQIDSVIGSASGFPINEEFLREMHQRCFVSDGLEEYERRHPVEAALSRAFLRALLFQAGLLVLFSLALDFGHMLRACGYSSLVFWVGVAMILLRRHSNPTKGDLVYIRWGLLVIVLIGVPAFLTVWRVRGAV
jgi:hypothetical protein